MVHPIDVATRAARRPRRPPDRCPPVDEAVSVAVVPRRTSGSRRAGRPVGHPTAGPLVSLLRPRDDQLFHRSYADRRRVRQRSTTAVHTLWTPVWTSAPGDRGRTSCGGGRRSTAWGGRRA